MPYFLVGKAHFSSTQSNAVKELITYLLNRKLKNETHI
jgi:hypothetical protein